jgi:Tol biopolymer transport system component/DNA-binding winged helix-turn-helix (wHTH) protein
MLSHPSPLQPSPPPDDQVIRFDRYEVDLCSGELRKEGRKIRLQPQPFQLLVLLLRNAGRIVSREDVRRELWPEDTFVDFDKGLAAAVNKIREALCDSAEKPRFVETLPRRGYRFIGEVALPEKVETPAPPAPSGAVVLRPWLTATRSAAIGILCAAGILAAIGIGRWRGAREEGSGFAPRPFTTLPGNELAPSFSPDGSRIAFAWDGGPENNDNRLDLYVKAVGSEQLIQLTRHPSDWLYSAWSPDGTQIAFHRMDGRDTGVYVVPMLGGAERKLIPTHAPYVVGTGISWSPDGKWIAYGDEIPDGTTAPENRIFEVSVETSEIRRLPHDPGCLAEAFPAFSHDGKKIFFYCVHSANAIEIESMPVGGGPFTRVLPSQNMIVGYALSRDDSRIVFSHGFIDAQLAVVNVETHEVQPIGAPEGAAWPSISRDTDKLTFSSQSASTSIRRRDLLHPEKEGVRLLSSTQPQNSAQYSPDGKHIAFKSRRGGPWALWMSDVDGGDVVLLSKDIANSGLSEWSPDGNKVAFDSVAQTPSSIYVVDIGERVPRKLVTDVEDIKYPSWSRDGKWIYFTSGEAMGHKLHRVPAGGGHAEELPSETLALFAVESPDGKYVYFSSRELNLQVKKFALNDGKREIEKEDIPRIAHFSVWRITPGGIYFVPRDAGRSMRFFDFGSHQVREVFTADKDFEAGISVSPDGRYLLYTQVDNQNADIMIADRYR